ncbi:hypothetical protein [Streptomyces sp. NPDC050982]|uniref:hypothetical protein n=1 Tax=Streptomyces sp. NPDC050982 TaxID=3154746 RepID=UPI0033E7F36C
MCLALLAFVVPLALLPRTVAQDRATAGPDAQCLHMAADARAPLTVFLADGSVLGFRAPRTSAVRLAALAGVSRTVERPGGCEIVVAVLGRPDGTAVIRAFVPAAELTRGVARSWLVLAGLGAALLLLGLLVADRPGRALVSPIAELSTVSHRLARAGLTARVRPDGPPGRTARTDRRNCARSPGRTTGAGTTTTARPTTTIAAVTTRTATATGATTTDAARGRA